MKDNKTLGFVTAAVLIFALLSGAGLSLAPGGEGSYSSGGSSRAPGASSHTASPQSGVSQSGVSQSGAPQSDVSQGEQNTSTATIRQGRLPGAEDYPINETGEGFLYTLNTIVTVDSSGSGNIMLENTPGNLCDICLEFTLDSTGEIIYASPMLAPNSYISGDTLGTVPEPGTYDITANIYAYDSDTYDELALKTRYITLVVSK